MLLSNRYVKSLHIVSPNTGFPFEEWPTRKVCSCRTFLTQWMQHLELPTTLSWPQRSLSLKITTMGPPGPITQSKLKHLQSPGAPRLVMYEAWEFHDEYLAADISEAVSLHPHILPIEVPTTTSASNSTILVLHTPLADANDIIINLKAPLFIGRNHFPLAHDIGWSYPQYFESTPACICCANYYQAYDAVWITVVCVGLKLLLLIFFAQVDEWIVESSRYNEKFTHGDGFLLCENDTLTFYHVSHPEKKIQFVLLKKAFSECDVQERM